MSTTTENIERAFTELTSSAIYAGDKFNMFAAGYVAGYDEGQDDGWDSGREAGFDAGYDSAMYSQSYLDN